jgi:thioredoxin-related protein
MGSVGIKLWRKQKHSMNLYSSIVIRPGASHCKLIKEKIFTLREVVDFFDSNFISVSVQIDTSAKDNDEIKAWYADAHQIDSVYQISAYPTFLYFSPKGSIWFEIALF